MMGSVCIEELNQESGSDNLIEYKPALPFKRLCALVIDVIITNIIAGAGGFFISFANSPQVVPPIWITLISLILTWLYYSLLEASGARATLGQRVYSLQVLTTDEKQLSFIQAGWRNFVFLLTALTLNGAFFCLSGLMVLFPIRKGLHDFLSGSMVVEEKIDGGYPEPTPDEQTDWKRFVGIAIMTILAIITVGLGIIFLNNLMQS